MSNGTGGKSLHCFRWLTVQNETEKNISTNEIKNVQKQNKKAQKRRKMHKNENKTTLRGTNGPQ